MVATAKPRRRKSATTSKYFSIDSLRPWNRQIVPRLGPRVGSQRAKRNRTPSRLLNVPVMAPLGAGFLASATSSIAILPELRPNAVYSSDEGLETGRKLPAADASSIPSQYCLFQRRGRGS